MYVCEDTAVYAHRGASHPFLRDSQLAASRLLVSGFGFLDRLNVHICVCKMCSQTEGIRTGFLKRFSVPRLSCTSRWGGGFNSESHSLVSEVSSLGSAD